MELDQKQLPKLLELEYQAINDAANELGGVEKIRKTFIDFQKFLYVKRAARKREADVLLKTKWISISH